MAEPLTAMVSYQSNDSTSAELLHEELALRGFTVFHDQCTFQSGTRVARSMDEAVNTCDGFVAYLTPSSLYETAAPHAPRPAIDSEFNPVMDRLARARADTTRTGGPVIIPLTHGLGNPRTEAPERVRRATGKDISTLWTPIVLDQSTSALTQPEAAETAKSLLRALLSSERVAPSGDPLELVVATRGTGQPPRFLTVDATTLFGGARTRPGTPGDWKRLLIALRDLESVLAGWTCRRRLHLQVKAHVTAAIAVGRVFNQAAGWQPVVEGRHGDTSPSEAEHHLQLRASLDKGAVKAALSVEIDLLGVQPAKLASGVIANLPERVPNRLCVWRDGTKDLTPTDVADMASATAISVRNAIFDIRPSRVHVFCASPVEFAVLLGRCLTSLHADLLLYERDGLRYAPSLIIPADIP